MEQNFIKMEESQESSNIIMFDETKKSNDDKKGSTVSRKIITKRSWKELSESYSLTSPKHSRKIHLLGNYLGHPFYESVIRKKNVNKNDEYEIKEMSEEDQRLMICYNYLKNSDELHINEIRIFECVNKLIALTLLKRYPFLIIQIDNEGYEIYKNAREIIFVNKQHKVIIKRFIISTDNLRSVLKDLGFISYYVKSSNNKIDKDNNIFTSIKEKESDSESSEVSLDPYKIFLDNKIKYIYNENQKPILNVKNFNNKFRLILSKLSDLNFNSKYYYKYSEDSFCMSNMGYEKAIDNFAHFRNSHVSKIVYLYGPKRCSKTTFLLYMMNTFKYAKIKFLYINFDYLEKIDIIQKKRIIYYELLYFCKDIEEMEEIDKKKIFNNITDKNHMEFIYLFLKSLLDVIRDNESTMERLIIIDNIYITDKEVLKYLDKIISLIKENKWYIKLIISGRGPYFNQKFYELFQDSHVVTNEDDLAGVEIYEFLYIYYADKNQIHNLMSEIQKKENENIDESNLKKDVENKIYSFYELYFSEELDKKTFSYEELEKEGDCLIKFPLEYFEIKIRKTLQKEFSFNFYNTSFKKCFRSIIGFEIDKGTLTKLLKRNDYPRTFLGICFEKLITLLLMHNKLNLHNLKFQKNNIKEIKKIAKLKENNYNGPKFKGVNINEPILLVQEDFFGPLYDLLIITKRNNCYYSDFVQIGVDKTKQQINDINDDLLSKYNIYKANIFKAFGIDSNFISVLFIFDYKTQSDNNYSTGFKICKDKSINFYLFSLLDCSLVELNQRNDKILVNEYSPSSIINISDNKNNSYNSRKDKQKNNKANKSTYNDAKITDFFEHNEI